MRIATNQLYDQNIRSIIENQTELADTQEQLSTGKKLNAPSDDPVGAAQVIRLAEELDKIDQYKRNNDLVTGSLEEQEAVLSSITSSANRARQLIIQAGNGINGDTERHALAEEIGQIRDEVLDLMNARSASGDYLFAGYQSEVQPFIFNEAATDDQITFEGDNGTRDIKLSDSVSIRGTASGFDVFENVEARKNISVTGTTGLTLNDAFITDQSAFDNFYDDTYSTNTFQLELISASQIQISELTTPATVLDTVSYSSGIAFNYNGIEFDIEGVTGDTLEFEFQALEKDNLAQTLHIAYLALSEENQTKEQVRETINDALMGIDNSMASISNEVATIGARLNVAQSIYETSLDFEVAAKEARSALEDVDYAEASSEFAKQETALSAAMTTFPKIANLTLFDFIR